MLTHRTSTVVIYQTDQYNDFLMIKGNRGLNMNKIKRITREIENGNDMLKAYPILVQVVNDKMDIFDGQHRFYICKKLKRPVHYIIVSDAKTMTDIAKVNSNVEKWKPQDFINCFVQQGNEHYKRLQEFIDKYGMSVGTSARMLAEGSAQGSNSSLTDIFERGLFKCLQWEKAVAISESAKLFSRSPLWRDRSFVIAIQRVTSAGVIKISDLVAAFHKHPEMLTRQASPKEYISNLERIINIGKHKTIRII